MTGHRIRVAPGAGLRLGLATLLALVFGGLVRGTSPCWQGGRAAGCNGSQNAVTCADNGRSTVVWKAGFQIYRDVPVALNELSPNWVLS